MVAPKNGCQPEAADRGLSAAFWGVFRGLWITSRWLVGYSASTIAFASSADMGGPITG